MGHGPPPHGREVDEGLFLTVLAEAVAALEHKDIPYVIMGGISSASLGRPASGSWKARRRSSTWTGRRWASQV